MSVKWVFPPSNGGTDRGFNDSGIETFTGARFDSLAREIIQNSLDASVDAGAKVTVEFDCFKIKRAEFPGADELLDVMQKCLDEVTGDEKSTEFFTNAVGVLKKQDIPCLRITDSGTTGLRGDYRKRKGQWHAITKGAGVSDKSDPTTAGGSYGIGKNAPFTVSALRTVFYSTLYTDENGNKITRAQGKATLVSHKIDDDDYTQADGYYGEEKRCMPMEESIPKVLLTENQGCVVLVPGFIADADWSEKIMATVVANFFCAINNGKLEVSIQDNHNEVEIIAKANLDSCFAKIEKFSVDKEKVQNSRYYHQAMQGQSRDKELPMLGHCKIWLHVDDGLPKRLALLRKTGMLITDKQYGLERWSTGFADFVGVVMCDSVKGNKLLREMENPQHNAFEPDRIAQEKRKKEAKKALAELVKWARGIVKDATQPKVTEVTNPDELKKLLPDIEPDENLPGDGGEADIEGRSVYELKPFNRVKRIRPVPDPDPNPDDDDKSPRKSVEINNVRVVTDTVDEKKKTVYFTPEKEGKMMLVLAVIGDDGRTENIVAKVDGVAGADDKTQGNKIEVCAKKTGAGDIARVELRVSLEQPVNDSIVVKAFED